MGCPLGCAAPQHLFRLIGDRIESQCSTAHRRRFHRLHSQSLSEKYEATRRILGAGVSGAVRLGIGRDGQEVAIKTLRAGYVLRNPEKVVKHLSREVELLLSVQHENIVKLLDAFERPGSLVIVTELLAGGTLQGYLMDREHLLEREAGFLSKEMFLSVGYLHSKSIVHRDVKPDNFMFAGPGPGEGVLKLIDLGFSKHFTDGKVMKSHKGTLSYMAPEVLQQQYTFKCDAWSLGVVNFRMLCGHLPFQDQAATHPMLAQSFEENIKRHILAGRIIFRNREAWQNLSANARDLVLRLLKLDAEERLSARDGLRHAWLCQPLLRPAKSLNILGSDEAFLSMLAAAVRCSGLSRAILMLMLWTKLYEGDPTSTCSGHSCPCFNDGSLRKAIAEPGLLSEPMRSLFRLFSEGCVVETDVKELLLELQETTELSHADVKETFSLIDTHGKGYITAEDLQLILGATLHGETMSQLLLEASEEAYLTYRQLSNHLMAAVFSER